MARQLFGRATSSPPPTPLSCLPSARVIALVAVLLLLSSAALAPAQQRVDSPVTCYDGDTCAFSEFSEDVRLARIDTPEMDGDCEVAAREARAVLRWKLRSAETVRVDSVNTGQYGRVIGEVYADGQNVSNWMLRHRFATRWPDREPCPTLAVEKAEVPGEPAPDPRQEPSRHRLPYDPNGPDRDCGDFSTHAQAQRFFEAAGGPGSDPHRLDGDSDGVACESLPGDQRRGFRF